MTIIGGDFTLSGNPVEDLKRYAKTKGISDEEAKKELQEIYGNPEEKQANVYTNDLGSGKNLDFLSARANYNLANQSIMIARTNIGKLLTDKGYENLSPVTDLVGNAKVEITYGNGVPCLQVFDENGACVGHMYMDNFEENGENQKNKLIMYGNETKPTTVFQFNNENKLEQIFDSNGKVTDPNENSTTTIATINSRYMERVKIKQHLEYLETQKKALTSQLFVEQLNLKPNISQGTNMGDLPNINTQTVEEIEEQFTKDLADLQKNLDEAQEKLSDRLNNFKDFS